MAVVETERNGRILIVRMNRPERLNALNTEMRQMLAETWSGFRRSKELEVAIFTGTGRGFCAGEDMKESLASGKPGGTRPALPDPFMDGTLEKPVIAAVNGFAMGGGFMLVERTDLRVAVPEAVFEVSEAKRWLLGGYNHGHLANLPYPIAMEMALGFRFTAERFYQVGFLNRLAPAEELIPSAIAMAEHLLSLPPASRVNTVHDAPDAAGALALAEGVGGKAARPRRQERSDGVARRLLREAQAQLQGLARPGGPLPDAEAEGGQVTAPPGNSPARGCELTPRVANVQIRDGGRGRN
jgi:enoyl-CoA hydratase/carnithine racemase